MLFAILDGDLRHLYFFGYVEFRLIYEQDVSDEFQWQNSKIVQYFIMH